MKEKKLNVSLESIIAHLPGHVYWLDRNNIFLGSNDLQAKAAGFENGYEIIGKSKQTQLFETKKNYINHHVRIILKHHL